MEDESESRRVISSDFFMLQGVPTHVLKYGIIDPDCPVLTLVIPGNPGIIEFYEKFMESLYVQSNYKMPVWGVSHSGHVAIPSHIEYPEPENDVFTLKGQIKNKLEFIQNHVPENTKIILIGHSIGCQMALEIMKSMPNLQVIKSLLLFPTIERMAESPHGQIATPMLKYLRWIALLIIAFLSYLSPIVQYRMIRYYFQNRNVASCSYNAAMNLFSPFCAGNSMYMAYYEMIEVVDADLDIIKSNLQKLIFYYGTHDAWCPIDYYKRMKKLFKNGNIYLDDRNMEHAFLLDSSEEMAVLCTSWIRHEVPKLFS